MQKLPLILTAIAAAGLIFLGGVIVGQSRADRTSRDELTAPPKRSEDGQASLGPGPRAAAAITADAETPRAPDRDASLPKLRAIAELNGLLQNKLGVSMLMGDELNKDFVVFFGLSPAQAAALKQALADARQALAELEARHARIAPEPDGRFTIRIPSFPEEGGDVHDRLMHSLRRVLGEEKYPLYQRIAGQEFENSSALGKFGLSETVINLSTNTAEEQATGARSTTNFDPEKGYMTQTVHSGTNYLRAYHPLLYRKMADEKLIPTAP